MGRQAGFGFDVRDGQLLRELSGARILSTAQLAQLAGRPEALGAFASRLARLAQGGWLAPIPRVQTASGAVTGWFRGDDAPPALDRERLAAEAIRLNALYAALRTGPNRVSWKLRLESPVTAVLALPGKSLHLFWAEGTKAARAAGLRFGSFLRDPERGESLGSEDEVLLLCDEPELRDALRREVERVRTRLPGGPASVHVSLCRDAVRVLHRRIHGGPLAVPVDPPEPELTANERARISEFLAEVL